MAGHIKKRKSERTGKVTFQARIPREGTTREHDVKTFDRRKDAERWLGEEQARRVRGEARDSSLPFRELVETWERTRAAKLAPKTRERYASVTRTYLLPEFGSTPLAKLDRPMVKRWFADLDVSAGTARKIHTVLSSIFDEGMELRLLRANPAARLRLATPERRDMTVLTAAEVRAVAEAVGRLGRSQDRLAIYMAAYTGLRAGELWALQRRDVDLANRRLLVERTLTSESGRLIFRNATKTVGSRRVISLPTFLANMLTEHLRGLDSEPTTLLFTAPGGGNGRSEGCGGPVRHELFRRRVFALAVKGRNKTKTLPAITAALPADKHGLRFHDLRHTCASLLIDSGASVLLVSKRLGHADPSMTLKVYGHLYPSHEAALADALDATFNHGNVTPLRETQAA